MLLSIIASCVLLVWPAHAFWILSHHPLVTERLDPIVSGAETSFHTHNFVGSADILGYQQNTTCTTAEVKDDRSRYWAPQLYYYNAIKTSFEAVPLSFVNTYYLNRGSALRAFPQGFKMIAGNAKNYDAPLSDSTAAKAISFVCLNYQDGSNQTQTMPKTPCPQGLRTQIVFPSCWNGVDLDSPDHQSHVAYPLGSNPDNGDCPSSHPIKFMTLFYEFIWSTDSLANNASGALVLANGDTTGYSFHADFISGWNTSTLQAAIDTCTGNLFGDLKSCQPFQASLQKESQGTSYCTVAPLLKENVAGPGLRSLPGCNPVRNGPFKGAGSRDPMCSNATASSVAAALATDAHQRPTTPAKSPSLRTTSKKGTSTRAVTAKHTTKAYVTAAKATHTIVKKKKSPKKHKGVSRH